MSVPPPVLQSRAAASTLWNVFQEAGYTAENLRTRLGMVHAVPASVDLRSQLAEQTNEGTPMHVFARWFLLGLPVDANTAEAALPSTTLALLKECGLIVAEANGDVTPAATVTPFEQFLVASDTRSAITSGTQADAVLFPNPTTELLSRFAIRRPGASVLDLGTGCGAVALAMAGDARTIVATDVNARAVAFAKFNAIWNGAGDIEILEGDRLAPVAGRSFDLIVSNPPFFVAPPSDFVACRNPFELDEFCRSLIRDAPSYLNDDGMLQILLEWVEIEGEPWPDRVRAWVSDLSCDVWLAKAYTKTPQDYAERRLTETSDRGHVDPDALAQWTAYLRARKVVQIHGGILAMRKRDAPNWIHFEDVDGFGTKPFGDTVLDFFRGMDTLNGPRSTEQLLESRPRLSPHARLHVQYSPGAGNWQPLSLRLRLAEGVQREVAVDSAVASFLAAFDGQVSLQERFDNLAQTMNATAQQVQPQALALVGKLIQKGLVLV